MYKYSVPLFYETTSAKDLKEILTEQQIPRFEESTFQPKFILNTSLQDAEPIFLEENGKLFIKFVLQKTYFTPESFDQIDYRYSIIFYFDLSNHCGEIRYDPIKYTNSFDNEIYEKFLI